MLYVGISRARDEAVVLTDNREHLIETLEANSGERLTALQAITEITKWDVDEVRGHGSAVESPVADELPETTWDNYQARKDTAAEVAFTDWCAARDRHAAAANAAGVYVSAHPGYDQLTAELRNLGESRDCRKALPNASRMNSSGTLQRLRHWIGCANTLIGSIQALPTAAHWAIGNSRATRPQT